MVNVAKHIKPSVRGELEITTVNQVFLNDKELKVQVFDCGFARLDSGTHDSLAGVKVIDELNSAITSTSFDNGWRD